MAIETSPVVIEIKPCKENKVYTKAGKLEPTQMFQVFGESGVLMKVGDFSERDKYEGRYEYYTEAIYVDGGRRRKLRHSKMVNQLTEGFEVKFNHDHETS